METDVVVVGAGPAGLAAAQQLAAHGLRPVVLERGDVAGFTWANLYDSLVLHTGKRMSSLPGLPFPKSYPTFIPRQAFWDYLRGYAERFHIPVQTRSPVTQVERTNGTWTIRTPGGEWRARAVVMATGIVANPVLPAFPGRERFRGQILHSAEYRRPGPFAGRRVLVVGVGNSGGEIASELAASGATVTVAVRSGANVVPLTILGIPIQYVSFWIRKLPGPLRDLIVAGVQRLTVLRWGPPVLPRPAHGPLDAIPLIGFHLVDAIRAGKIAVRPGLAEFTADGVRFTDGRAEPFDDVILATGFAAALGPLGTLVRRDAKGFALRVDRVASADHPGLYFVGHNYDAGGGLYNIGVDSRLTAAHVARGLA
jgi:cation diffusion facilitator CzcD-associated flavoprotein CzcO